MRCRFFATGPGICRALLLPLIAFATTLAEAQVLSLTSGDAAFVFLEFPEAVTDPPATAFLLSDGDGSAYVTSHWWHYRQATDSREYALSSQTLRVIDPDPYDHAATLRFLQPNFTWGVVLTLNDGPVPNWATLEERYEINATGPFRIIDYIDVDVDSADYADDCAWRIPARWDDGQADTQGIQVYDTIVQGDVAVPVVVNYRTTFAHIGDYLVADIGQIADGLTDEQLLSFDDSGLPFGGDAGGDFTAATSVEIDGEIVTGRVIEVRPVETITRAGNGSFAIPSYWSGTTGNGDTTPQNWRVAIVPGHPGSQMGYYTTIDSDVVVRSLHIGGGSGYVTVDLNTPHLLGVITDTVVGGGGGILRVSDGILHTHSLSAGASFQFEHTDGQVIIDGGTINVPGNYYDIDGTTAADLPSIALINSATWTQPVDHGINVAPHNRGKLIVESGSSVALSGIDGILVIGSNYGAEGEVIVTGPSSQISLANTVNIGISGRGTLRILDGGLVTTTGPANVGGGGAPFVESLVEVRGVHSQPSTLRAGRLNVGYNHDARLEVTQGGRVEIQHDVQIGPYFPLATATVSGGDSELRVLPGGSLSVGNEFAPSGNATLKVQELGLVHSPAVNVRQSGSIELDSGTLSVTSGFDLEGTLSGRGNVLLAPGGSFANHGLVSPGGPDPDFEPRAGLLTIHEGRFMQDTGELLLHLGGTSPDAYDRLQLVGEDTEMILGGTLTVSLADLGSGMYTPSVGDVLSILTAGASRIGEFEVEQLPRLGGGLFFDVQYESNAVRLAVLGVNGDYNYNGSVDAADYVVWRKSVGQSGTALLADGNHNGAIDDLDFNVWRANFGRTGGSILGQSAKAPPIIAEPAGTISLLAAGLYTAWTLSRRRMNSQFSWPLLVSCIVEMVNLSTSARADIVSSFDVDSDGWAMREPHDEGTLSRVTDGGGALQWVESAGGVSDYFQAPAKFLGNWAAAGATSLSFDYKLVSLGADTPLELRFYSSGVDSWRKTWSVGYFPQWTHFIAELNDAGWTHGGTGTKSWHDSLLNITALYIDADLTYYSESTRLDNVRLTASEFLPGDFNGDGSVDAADYVVWRKSDGTQAGYNTWRANFGHTAGSGGGSSIGAVPEPAAVLPFCLMLAGLPLLLGNRPAVRPTRLWGLLNSRLPGRPQRRLWRPPW